MKTVSTKKLQRNKLCIWLVVASLSLCAKIEKIPKVGAKSLLEKTDKIIYVDCFSKNASDQNTGELKEQPLKSIARSFSIAKSFLRKGTSVKITVGPGIYRETVSMNINKSDEVSKATPLIIEGSKSGKTVLTGLMKEGFQASTWKAVRGCKNVYVHDWPEPYKISIGWAANPVGKMASGPTMRSEMLLLDRQLLEMRILDEYKWIDPDGPRGLGAKGETNADGEMVYQGVAKEGLRILDKPWTYAVASHKDAPEKYRNKIFMRLPDNKRPKNFRLIEVSRKNGNTLFSANHKSNMIIRNLTISHASSNGWGSAFELKYVDNVTIENCDFTSNFYQGMGGVYNNSTFSNCRFNNNGGGGANGQFHNCFFVNCEFNFNNSRENLGNMPFFGGGGMKVGKGTKNAVFLKCSAIGNVGAGGLWDDVGCSNLRFEKCFVYGNSGHGLFNELANPGCSIYNNCISAYNGSGIKLSSSRNPTVNNCLFVNNHREVLIIVNGNRAPKTKEQFLKFTIQNNTFYTQRGKFTIFIDDAKEQLPVVDVDNNKYFYSGNDQRFFVGKHGSLDFKEWKKLLKKVGTPGQDKNSTFQKTSKKEMDFTPGSMLSKLARSMGIRVPYKDVSISRKKRVEKFVDKL